MKTINQEEIPLHIFVDDIAPVSLGSRKGSLLLMDRQRFPEYREKTDEIYRVSYGDLLFSPIDIFDQLLACSGLVEKKSYEYLSEFCKKLKKYGLEVYFHSAFHVWQDRYSNLKEKEIPKIRKRVLREIADNDKRQLILDFLRTLNPGDILPYSKTIIAFFNPKDNKEVKTQIEKMNEALRDYHEHLTQYGKLTPESVEAITRYEKIIGGASDYPPSCVETLCESRKQRFLTMIEWTDFSPEGLMRLHDRIVNSFHEITIFDSLVFNEEIESYFEKHKIEVKFSKQPRFDLARIVKGGDIPEMFYSFFSDQFYPCRIDCPEAMEKGKRIYESCLNVSEQLAQLYQAHLFFNFCKAIAGHDTKPFSDYSYIEKNMVSFLSELGILKEVKNEVYNMGGRV